MPTVKDTVQISVKDATAALPTPTYGEIIVVGEDSDNLADFNVVYTFYSQAEVEQKFGANSPIAKATAKIFAQGVAKLKAVNVMKDDGAGNPIADYDTVLSDLVTNQVDYDIIVGTIDASDTNAAKLVSHADSYNKVLVMPQLGDASTVTTALGNLIANEWVYAVAHDDTTSYTPGEVAGAAAGAIAGIKNWIPAEWQSVSGINAAGYSPSDVSTIEQAGGNTFIQVGSQVVLSGGKALDGSWLDVSRTKQYLVDLIETDLVNLKLRKAGAGQKIPFTPAGLKLIESTLIASCKRAQEAGALREDYVDENGNLVRGYEVVVPSYDSISDTDKANRTLSGVTVTAYLSGGISVISLDLVISL